MTSYNIIDNKIQISFPGKPDSAIRTLMKANGILWNRAKQVWIGEYTPEREEIAKRVVELNDAGISGDDLPIDDEKNSLSRL